MDTADLQRFGAIAIAGAQIAYGPWFYLVAGIAVLSLLVAVGIYWLGNATSERAACEATVEHA